MKVKHILKPIYDENSKVLILGSLPSVKSREIGWIGYNKLDKKNKDMIK